MGASPRAVLQAAIGMFRESRRVCQSLSKLTGIERWWLIEAVFLLPATAVALRCFGLRRLQRWLARSARPTECEPDTAKIARARSMARVIGIASRRGFFDTTCLHRSLLLCWWLRGLGIPGDLRIGVRSRSRQNGESLQSPHTELPTPTPGRPREVPGPGPFEIHAWVECQGVVLNDAADIQQHFVPFDGEILSTRVALP